MATGWELWGDLTPPSPPPSPAAHPAPQEKGTQNAQWWAGEVGAALGGPDAFVRVGLRQMSGILVIVYCRKALYRAVGEVHTSSVACGVMGVGGNKGAAAVSMSVHRCVRLWC